MDEREILARQRFIVLNLARFSGVALVMLGILFISKRILPDTPEIIGYIFLLAGVLDFFLMPILLKRSWNKQDAGKP
jgi:hypothetical protein